MSSDRVVMCLVCGKKFPRGVLDLARHTTAITLMHLASRKPKPDYNYKCDKCELYFKTESHLDIHTRNVCSSAGARRSTSPSSASVTSNGQADDDEIEHGSEVGEEDKTSECMVCGKLFPRGPIDLARHQTAVTLRHLVHPRHTSAFHYGCKKCGLHFASPEHLASHTEQSSCNEDMVWPTTVTPGSRCVTRAEAAELERSETSPGKATTPKAEVPVSESKPAKRAASVEEEQDLPTKRVHKKSAVSEAAAGAPLSKYMLNKLALQHQKEHQQQQASASSVGTKRGRGDAAAASAHPAASQLTVTDLYVPRLKRAKVIVPEDREAFFAVVSLLIDPATVPESVRLAEDNYEAYLPAQHRKLVDALKANLFCTC